MTASALGVRTRLTLWYAAALTLSLAAYGGGIYVLLRQALFSNLDLELRQDLETEEEALPDLLSGNIERASDPERWSLELYSAEGDLLRSWPALKSTGLSPPGNDCHNKHTVVLDAISNGGLALRGACRQVDVRQTRYVFRAFRSAAKVSAELERLATLMLVGLPAAVALAAIGGYLLAWRSLRPIKQMTIQAERISATRLAERLPISNSRDELGRLATSFNDMFARLESGFEQMRRFTADASHELRTPLTAIRSMGEVALQGDKDLSSTRDVLASILEETDHLAQLIDSLLTLSRADAGQLNLRREAVDITQLAHEVVAHLSVLAEEKRQTIILDCAPAAAISGDRVILRRALINLVDNAIKYSPQGSTITLRVRLDNGVIIEVYDEGPGIPVQHQERIFDRFYRIDTARDRPQGGTGLGLAIVRWSIEAHGGHIGVTSNGVRGSVFRLSFPAA